jgi:hypothetical protein
MQLLPVQQHATALHRIYQHNTSQHHAVCGQLTWWCCPAEENPGLALGEVGKKLGAMWREMSAEDKKVYEVRRRPPPVAPLHPTCW